MKDKNILYEIERYCNNYFNPANDPKSEIKNYPPALLQLVKEIKKYQTDENGFESKSSITSFSEGSVSISKDIQNNSWLKLFERELSIYKRAKFI